MNSDAMTIDSIAVFIPFMTSSIQWIPQNETQWLYSGYVTLTGRRFVPIEVRLFEIDRCGNDLGVLAQVMPQASRRL